MNRLPTDIWREVFGWLVGDGDGAAARVVCREWDKLLRGLMVVCCVHEYVEKAMVCRVVYGRKGEEVQATLHRHGMSCDGKGIYTFPHCTPGRYDGTGVCDIANPAVTDVLTYSPQIVPNGTEVSSLPCTRLLLNERRVDDPSFGGEGNSFENYMRLLLRFQVKQQEYAFERHSRTRLLRTYIYNLEHRIACKLRLLLEHISYLCVRYMVVLLPYVESSLGTDPTPKDLALRHILFRYRSVQDQVDRECALVGSGYHAPVKSFKIPSLERYANFLCTADDILEAHVVSCKNLQPPTKSLEENSSTPEGNTAHFPPPTDEPTIEAMLQAIITVCSSQRAFIKPELEAAENAA